MELEHLYHCDRCEFHCKTKSQMKVHIEEKHTFICTVCETKSSSHEDMEEHKNEAHTTSCPASACERKFPTAKEVEEHQTKDHPFLCIICYIEEVNKEDLEKHIEDCHTYTCDVCGFVAISEDIMENHILDKHARPDSDGEFKCDDCEFNTKDKRKYGEHYKEVHGSRASKNVNPPDNHKMKEELRILKNNFDRLETMYQDSLDQVNNVKSEYEVKLIKANDDYNVVKTENEVLKEKVDVLFKLGRSYIENCVKKKTPGRGIDEVQEVQTEEIQEVPITDEANDNIEDLQGWTANKMRGFKRTTPVSDSAPKKPDPPKHSKHTPSDTKPPPPTPSSTGPPASSSTANPPPSKAVKEKSQSGRTMYCHYFSNLGKCLFEERTGNSCRFEHKPAPLCQSGTSCMRSKCMFTHPNMAGRNTFLAQSTAQPMNINPWQTMNPWWTQNSTQMPFPNPWSMNMANQ